MQASSRTVACLLSSLALWQVACGNDSTPNRGTQPCDNMQSKCPLAGDSGGIGPVVSGGVSAGTDIAPAGGTSGSGSPLGGTSSNSSVPIGTGLSTLGGSASSTSTSGLTSGSTSTGGNSRGETLTGGVATGGIRTSSGALTGGVATGGIPLSSGTLAGRTATGGIPTIGTGGVGGSTGTGGVAGTTGLSLIVTPLSLTFDPTNVGATSAPKVVMVANTGNSPIALYPIVNGAGFTVDSTTCGASVTTGCTVTMRFAPDSANAMTGILTIAPGFSVSMSGTGTEPNTFRLKPSVIPETILLNANLYITVTVTATSNLSDLLCLPDGPDLKADADNTTCTAAIAANTPCLFAFTFKATTVGAKKDSIVCSAAGVVKALPVTPTVVTPPSLVIAPTFATFATAIGTTSLPLTFAVANAGGSASGSLTALLRSSDPTAFAITDNNCIVPLAPLATCTINVVYLPTTKTRTSSTGTLTVTASAPGSASVVANLTGTVAAPALLQFTGETSFGVLTVGESSPTASYMISNNGGVASGTLTVASTDPQFAVSNDQCSGLSLAASSSCTFGVTFSPTKVGFSAATLTVTSAGTPLTSQQLSGTAIPAQ
jgi:hypothetical protein